MLQPNHGLLVRPAQPDTAMDDWVVYASEDSSTRVPVLVVTIGEPLMMSAPQPFDGSCRVCRRRSGAGGGRGLLAVRSLLPHASRMPTGLTLPADDTLECVLDYGVNLPGSDLSSSSAASVEECCALCSQASDCTSFSMSGSTCTLKSDRPTDRVAASGTVSGYAPGATVPRLPLFPFPSDATVPGQPPRVSGPQVVSETEQLAPAGSSGARAVMLPAFVATVESQALHYTIAAPNSGSHRLYARAATGGTQSRFSLECEQTSVCQSLDFTVDAGRWAWHAAAGNLELVLPAAGLYSFRLLTMAGDMAFIDR